MFLLIGNLKRLNFYYFFKALTNYVCKMNLFSIYQVFLGRRERYLKCRKNKANLISNKMITFLKSNKKNLRNSLKNLYIRYKNEIE